jgi:membrane protein
VQKVDRIRSRYRWLDHLVLAGVRYQSHHGDHYAAAITYFSVLALVPLLMVAFAAAGFVLAANESLIAELQAYVSESAPGDLGRTLNEAITEAIESRTAVGIIGLLVAAYSGLGWMGNLREALTAQWDQPHRKPSFVRAKGGDALALAGLGLALLVSFGLTAAGSAFATELLELVGLQDQLWARVLVVLLSVVLALAGNWLVFLWVIARLPREPVTFRSAARAALAGAVGFEVLKQLGTLYLRSLGGSPAAAVFGPVIGLLVFAFLVSRFLLYMTAWAATARENLPDARTALPRGVPPPAVIRPRVTVRSGPDSRTATALVTMGAVLGLVISPLLRRRAGR